MNQLKKVELKLLRSMFDCSSKLLEDSVFPLNYRLHIFKTISDIEQKTTGFIMPLTFKEKQLIMLLHETYHVRNRFMVVKGILNPFEMFKVDCLFSKLLYKLDIKLNFCPVCKNVYVIKYGSKAEARKNKDNIGLEQFLTGICTHECWEKLFKEKKKEKRHKIEVK